MDIDICLSPALFETYNTDESVTVVVVDVFRATTCMCVAMDYGVKSILPIANIEVAKQLKSEGYMVAAERNVAKCDFADFGNSPFDYMTDKAKGQEIAVTTTNGTKAIEKAKSNDRLLIGSFANIGVLSDYFLNNPQNILILCSGWNNMVNIEDTLFAGALAEKLLESENYSPKSDSVRLALKIWQESKNNLWDFINQSDHVKRLLKHNLERDIDFCLTMNTVKSIPFFDKTINRLTKL